MTADRSVTLPVNAAGGAAEAATPALPAVPARSWTLELPPGTPIITGNNRLHRYAKNARTRVLKDAVVVLARRQRIPRLGRVDVVVEYETPPRRKADRHPLASDAITDPDGIDPTKKALVDGLVLAGVLRSDTSKWVRDSVSHLAPVTHPRGLVRITLTEVPGA